jgi:hypothetical protein
MQHSNALLNVDTMEVICTACNGPVNNISESMKRALKSFGQILKTDIKKAFVMACRKCNANREVVMNAKEETICKICKGPIRVHAAMKQAIKEFGQKDVIEIVESEKATTEAVVEAPKPKTRKRKVKAQKEV